MKNSFLIILFFFCSAFTIKHPVPSLPSELNPTKANDVFSLNLIAQIHASLFTIGIDHVPMPILVNDFSVSKDQLSYHFKLKTIFFNPKRQLNAVDVKQSIQRAISNKIPGYEKLIFIEGYDNFINKKEMELKGIRVDSKLNFSILLIKPLPTLIHILSDIRFAIFIEEKNQIFGLGDYFLKGKYAVELKKKVPYLAEKVTFIKVEKKKAIEGFLKGVYDDLFMYQLSKEENKVLKNKAHIQAIPSPRTYLFSINSALISNKQVRSSLQISLNPTLLLESCFIQEKPTSSIIPPGFIGFFDKKKIPYNYEIHKEGDLKKPKAISINILKGVGSENCIKEYLIKVYKANNIKAKVEIVETNIAIKNWMAKKIHGMFYYLEAEMNLDFMQFFNPKSELCLSSQTDKVILKLLNPKSELCLRSQTDKVILKSKKDNRII